MRHRFRFAGPSGPFDGDDLFRETPDLDAEDGRAPASVTRLLCELHTGSPLVDELRVAVGDARDERDGTRFALSLLGAMAFASRKGCRPVQVRRFAEAFVRTALEPERDAAVVDDCAARAVGVVDSLYFLHGVRAFAGDPRMLADVALMLEG